jgi:hypothetical protein
MRHLPNRCVRAFLFCGLVVSVCAGVSSAQYGTAPNNYYPEGYHGSTFTGTVIQNVDGTITLTYAHGSKLEKFEGRITAPCILPSNKPTTVSIQASKLQIGGVITAFYEATTVKIGGQKQKENQIVAMSFKQVNGKEIAEDQKGIFYCIPPPYHTYFKAFQ